MLKSERLRNKKRGPCRVVPLWDWKKKEKYEPLSDLFLEKYGRYYIRLTVREVNDVKSIFEELPAAAEKTKGLLLSLKDEVGYETVKKVLAGLCDEDARVLLHKIKCTERILSALKEEIAN